MSDVLTRFETIGDLYYRRHSRLRPGKSDVLRYSNSDENRTLFDQWFATHAFTDAIDRVAVLTDKVKALEDQIEETNEYE